MMRTCTNCWPANCGPNCKEDKEENFEYAMPAHEVLELSESEFDEAERAHEQYVINQACGGNWHE